jgi:iron complex transport system substrate-binding protein
MNIKKTALLITLLTIALALGACGGSTPEPTEAPPTEPPATEAPVIEATATSEPEAEPMTLTDSNGRQVTLAAIPERIVSMSPSNTEMLFAIGAGEQIVGRDDFSDYPEQALDIASIGSTYGELNTEVIVDMEPDLVLAAGITPPEHITALESVGLTVYVLGNPVDFAGLFDNLRAAGQLTGHAAEADALADELQSRYEAIVDQMKGVEPVSVFYEVDGTDPNSPWTTGSGTFQDLAIGLAGGENIFSDLEGWGQVSLEEIVIRDPSIIVFADGSFVPTTVESLKQRAGWGGISAIQQDEVYAMNTDLLDLPGPRLVLGLETIAEIMHPEMFTQ